MFRESRRKIVLVIMIILIFLLAGTLGIIYGFSYSEVSDQNREMLERYVELYSLEQQPGDEAIPEDILVDKPGPDKEEVPFEDTPAFRLSTFYSVVISHDDEVLAIDNDSVSIYSDDELIEIASEIMNGHRKTGIKGSLIFCISEKEGYTLVAFMDNTIMHETITTLFQYTLIFGGIVIIAVFFISIYLAKRIVQPLEEGYQKQRQFLSDAGHELKTPVAVVGANAELLSREVGENQWLSNIQYENERMGILIGQMLDLTRTESVSVEMDSVNLSHLVNGEALPFESVAFENGQILKYEIEENLFIKGNSGELKKIISILLDNAIGHGKKEEEIVLTLKSEHNFAILSVVNGGEAIPEEQRQQLFERFYRADFARNGETNHYGLGLAIAKAIVTVHKGKIEVQCYDGKVEFVVQLPLKK